jgi:hypothetical protein
MRRCKTPRVRPEADLPGAVYHATGSLECVARDFTGNSKATLGEVLKPYPGLLPKPATKPCSTCRRNGGTSIGRGRPCATAYASFTQAFPYQRVSLCTTLPPTTVRTDFRPRISSSGTFLESK